MEQAEQVFFNVPLSRLEPIFKRWIKEAQAEMQPEQAKPTEPPRPEFLTIQETAKFLNLTVPTIYTKVSRGELPGALKTGKKLFFDRQVLENWIRSGRIKTQDEMRVEAENQLAGVKKKGGKK